jgi:hypothetical protein
MEPNIPEGINEAVNSLKEFEKSLNQAQPVKLHLFDEGMSSLANYLEVAPSSPFRNYIINIQISYTRQVITSLKNLDINFAKDTELADFYIKVLIPMQKHMENVFSIDPLLKEEYEKFLKKWQRNTA